MTENSPVAGNYVFQMICSFVAWIVSGVIRYLEPGPQASPSDSHYKNLCRLFLILLLFSWVVPAVRRRRGTTEDSDVPLRTVTSKFEMITLNAIHVNPAQRERTINRKCIKGICQAVSFRIAFKLLQTNQHQFMSNLIINI